MRSPMRKSSSRAEVNPTQPGNQRSAHAAEHKDKSSQLRRLSPELPGEDRKSGRKDGGQSQPSQTSIG
jgi:hypothetical protein